MILFVDASLLYDKSYLLEFYHNVTLELHINYVTLQLFNTFSIHILYTSSEEHNLYKRKWNISQMQHDNTNNDQTYIREKLFSNAVSLPIFLPCIYLAMGNTFFSEVGGILIILPHLIYQ